MDDFEDIGRLSLVESEDASYKPKTGMFSSASYPYSSANDFKSLTPEQIITRRIKLIKPDVEAGQGAKKFLSEPQRKALLRLMSIKKVVESLPKEKQDKARVDLIFKYEMSQPEKENIEMLLDEASLKVNEEKVKQMMDKKDYDELAVRVKKTFSKEGGFKKTRRVKKSKSRSRKSKSRKSKSKSRKSKSKSRQSKSRQSRSRKSRNLLHLRTFKTPIF